MNKYTVLAAIAILAVVLILWNRVALYQFEQNKKTAPTIEEQIALLLADKYSKSVETTQIKVDQETGNFSKGSVNFTDETGGGIWFAAKTNSGWEIVYDGNGIIPCDSANTYNFPTSIIPVCIDTENDNRLVQRDNLIGGQIDEQGCFTAAGYSWNEDRQQCIRVWELPTIREAEESIISILAEKYNKSSEEIRVKIIKIDGFHVSGSINFAPGNEVAGGQFLAFKEDNNWQLVYDGNGSIDCNKMRQIYGFSDIILKPNFCD